LQKPVISAILSTEINRKRQIVLTTPNRIKVAILDDHQTIIDGYLYRLGTDPDIEVVATAAFAEEFNRLVENTHPDVLILDVFAPTSPDNPNVFPILQDIPGWLQRFPHLSILVISMHQSRSLVRAVMEAGASGYVLKDDTATLQELASVIRSIAGGGVHLSKRVHQHLLTAAQGDLLLTTRQLQALSLCAAYPDAPTDDLASRMGVAHSTLRNLLSSAYVRLEVHNRMAAITKARQLGLIPPQEPSTIY
jgi:two-component system nitrate/nitrite response regulator NarL